MYTYEIPFNPTQMVTNETPRNASYRADIHVCHHVNFTKCNA